MADPRAIAFANNDYVHVAWDFGPNPLPNCGGFALFRIGEGEGDDGGTPVSTFGRDAQGKQTRPSSFDEPIFKYSWRDVLAKRGKTYRYRVVALEGPRKPLAGVAPAWTKPVTLTPTLGNAQVFFNRGLLATQATADFIWDPAHKKPDFAKLTAAIEDPTNPLRARLYGQHFGALTQLLDRAEREGGSIWASLYELTDKPLIDKLAACTDLHLVLSNNNGEGKGGGQYDLKNGPAAQRLKATARELHRRYMPAGQIGHNKFVVYKDAHGVPDSVLTGSTNWTATGLCTQSNNAIIIKHEKLAAAFIEYWEQLKADAEEAVIPSAAAPMKKIQGKTLRKQCGKQRALLDFDGRSTIRTWFSPNTAGLLKPKAAVPVDMAEVYAAIAGARQSVLFLAFMPGKSESENSMHFLKELAKAAVAKPALFIRGAVSDPGLTREYDRTILKSAANEDSMISSPQGIFKNFDKYRKEIYKYGHAIIHDKVIVIDPLSDKDCVVVLGSHNLGYRASSNNDENMLIVRGNPAIARAYAMHVMDVFEHYRSRWISANNGKTGYDPAKDPRWQERYFDDMKPALAERLFWLSEGKPLPPLKVNPKQVKALEAAIRRLEEKQAAAAAKKAAKDAAKKKPARKKKPAARKKPPGKKKPAAKKSSPR